MYAMTNTNHELSVLLLAPESRFGQQAVDSGQRSMVGQTLSSTKKGDPMARPLRIEYEGAFYHITARGNERRRIFLSKADHEKFLANLRMSAERFFVGPAS